MKKYLLLIVAIITFSVITGIIYKTNTEKPANKSTVQSPSETDVKSDNGKEKLFLNNDISQSNNLVNSKPDIVEELSNQGTSLHSQQENKTGEESNNLETKNAISIGTTQTINFDVGPEIVDCVGAFPQKCMIVNGEYFYDEINGFEFESGYEYRLQVERKQTCDPNITNNCPQDVGIYEYNLVKEISKTNA